MKKVLKGAAIVIMAILSVICITGIWLYNHPIQETTTAFSKGVQYPVVMYQSYPWFQIPPKEYRQMEEFNEGVQATVQKMEKKYSKEIDLTFDLDRHDKGGVTVTIYGTGTKADGVKEEFKETHDYSITLKRKI